MAKVAIPTVPLNAKMVVQMCMLSLIQIVMRMIRFRRLLIALKALLKPQEIYAMDYRLNLF